MLVESILIVVGSKPEKKLEPYILLTKLENNRWGNYALPRDFIEHWGTSDQVASHLLMKHTGLQAIRNGTGWVPLLQKKVIEDIDRTENGEHCLAVPYVTLIPNILPITDAEWIRIQDLSTINLYKDHLSIINKVLSGG